MTSTHDSPWTSPTAWVMDEDGVEDPGEPADPWDDGWDEQDRDDDPGGDWNPYAPVGYR